MKSALGLTRFLLFFLCVGAFLFCTCPAWAQDNDQQIDADTQKAIKQFVSSSGNFKKLAGATKFMVPTFNVEYTYQRYSARVGEETKIGNITKTALTDSYQTLELDEETYKRLTDALYDSFVSAMAQYTGLEVIDREVMTAEPVYQEISGKEKDDTKDHFVSVRRGGNVKTGDKGAETVTYAPTGMVVQGMKAAFQGSKFNDVAGKLGADAIMAVTLFVDFNKKTDTFFIKTADVRISDDLRKREKMIPFKGPVPGEFIYEFFAMQDLGLKKPVSTEVKVTDRRTGFFEQVSGSYSIDTHAAAQSILEAYNTVAAMQAMEAARKMK
ncbi:MAG: hypothetical protein QMD09_12930 [Desulfatibacillaceae bacterium]|nr:hypothetical protein [Desulfatibacillaceae bacterium]